MTAPSPTDADHDPVHRGLRNDEFEPTLEGANGADSAGESGGDR